VIGNYQQRPRPAVIEILDFMRKRGLTLNDLIQTQYEDPKKSDLKRVEKSRRVEKCWSLMAARSVKFADLEQAPQPIPDKRSRRRRGEGHFSEVIENKEVSGTSLYHTKPNEINDLADSAPVGDPQLKFGIGGMSLDHACQSGQHAHAERGLDLNETPPVAIEALLAVEKLPHWLLEPCAGRGAIASVLRCAGHAVVCSDVIQRDDFRLHFVADFMALAKAPVNCDAIVTNPPYQIATEFTRHALDLVPRVYLLLRLAFLESKRHTDILERRGLARVRVFRARLPMRHRHNWQGPRASSAIPFAWFVWDRDHHGPTVVDRIGSNP
jgi:hypothetical protein